MEVSNGEFPIESAQIRISYNKSDLGSIADDELTIFYANPETQQLEELDDVRVDGTNQTITGTTKHLGQFVAGSKSIPSDLGVDIVLAIDQSGSMDTYDPQDLRISETKYFIENLKPTQQVGIVEFASEAYVKSELTSDYESLKDVLGTMYNPQYSGTNISAAIETAAGLFNDDNRHKIIILLTDGESNIRRGEEALVAKELKEEGIIF
ncbi:VWA domain-containing protein [Herbivorax sp. ANBcel31]|uniref:vWA domain-containing protein n=1 Tax=Herbivorax sp. ANBcel31 TaxID=3069754 RepID=UPI0027B7E697|nr:VWA domain-containing protein [Herbivorax sp. ANBcel31]MDQ2087980.1 VWA domain-containing protein [Herbivorax sp. ANBcel31]